MRIVYDPAFFDKLKKVDIRIKKSTKQCLMLFSRDPNSSILNNHPLRGQYQGYRSINITADYRALFKERTVGEETLVEFLYLGTHAELYKNSTRTN